VNYGDECLIPRQRFDMRNDMESWAWISFCTPSWFICRLQLARYILVECQLAGNTESKIQEVYRL
jgi:hypothetical protein